MSKPYIFLILLVNLVICYCKEELCSGDPFDFDVAHVHREQKHAVITRPAPYWESKGAHMGKIKDVKLTDFLGQYLIMLFYPLDFTFVCPTEIIAFNDKYENFKNIGAEIVALSIDSVYTHLAFLNTPRSEGGLGNIAFPLISDTNHEISKTYGVYMDNLGHTLRGMFIIDKKGILRQITINDTPVGRNVEEAYRLVQAFQYADEHDEVCPAGWKKPGDPTITPNPQEKTKYFKKQSHEL